MINLPNLFKALWFYIAGIIAVGAMYYLLTGVEQGVDVVIKAGEFFWSSCFTFIAVFLWAFLVWYSARMLSYIRQNRDDQHYPEREARIKYGLPTPFHQHIPRILSFNCFVCVQVAILQLPTFFHLKSWQMLLVILAHNLFYFLIDRFIKGHSRHWIKVVLFAVIFMYASLLATLIFVNSDVDLNGPLRHKFWLSVMALMMFIMEVVIVYIFNWRRKYIDMKRNDTSLTPLKFLRTLGLTDEYNKAEKPLFIALQLIATLALSLYILTILSIKVSAIMGPMAFVVLALGVLVGFSNLVSLASIRLSFNLFIIIYIWAFFWGIIRDPYKVRLTNSNRDEIVFDKRPTTQQYLKMWFQQRLTFVEEDTVKKFPVYIVLSNGGASRAGKWTTSVLSYLQDSSYTVNPKNSFKDHLLCIAGASGGTVGNAAFYSLLRATHENEITANQFSQHANTLFNSDFLTYTLARLLGPDVFRHLSPIQIAGDRAAALEDVITYGSEDTLFHHYFSSTIDQVFDDSGTLPVFFINATQVDNGMPGVISSVKLPSGSKRTDILTLVDNICDDHQVSNIHLNTAAVLSSRFPYVSPAGKIYDRYYVDGGYFDNSGAGTVLEFIQELEKFFADSTNQNITMYRDKLIFKILHITNSDKNLSPPGKIHPVTNDLLSPVLTLAGMQGSSTNIGNNILINEVKRFTGQQDSVLVEYSLYEESKGGGSFEEGYPMSWVISDYQLHRMNNALKKAVNKNRPLVCF